MRGTSFHVVSFFLLASAITFWVKLRGQTPPPETEISHEEEEFVLESKVVSLPSLDRSGNEANESDQSAETAVSYTSFSFNQRVPPPGKYVDRIDMSTSTEMDMMGMNASVLTTMHMESESTLVAAPEVGGTSIDSIVTVASFRTQMTGAVEQDLSCDSAHVNDKEPSTVVAQTNTEEESLEAAMCQPFYDLVGQNFHYVMDEEGNIVTEDDDEEDTGLTSALATTGSSTSTSAATDKLAPSNSLAQSSRLLMLLPEHPVEIGEEWVESIDMDEVGTFEGTSKFIGFQEYEGVRCAVIESTGTLEMDFGKVASKFLGDDMGELLKQADIHVTDAVMKATIFWDEEQKISRWSKNDISMIMTMKSPLGGGSTSSMPITETVTMTTDILD